jgi:hypothetical protein
LELRPKSRTEKRTRSIGKNVSGENPHGLFDRSAFNDQTESDTFICPEGKTLTRKQLHRLCDRSATKPSSRTVEIVRAEALYQVGMAYRLTFHRWRRVEPHECASNSSCNAAGLLHPAILSAALFSHYIIAFYRRAEGVVSFPSKTAPA